MQFALDPAGHRVPRTKPTCLLHTWRPHWRRSFTLVLHLHQHQSSRNLHLQYLAKNQSSQCCQSLINQEATIHWSSNHTWSSISPLMSALTTHTYSSPREEKKKRNEEERNFNKRSKANQRQREISLEEDKSRTPYARQRLNTSETKLCSSKERKPPNQGSKPQRAPPAHMQAPPEPMQPPLDECMPTTRRKQSSCIISALTGQTDRHHRSDRCPTCEQNQHSDRLDR
jgi:hypothetical protein